MAKNIKHPKRNVIKRRYLSGEKPSTIGPDFGLTSRQVSDMARNGGWTKTKTKIASKIEAHVVDEFQRLADLTISVHIEFMQKLKGQMEEITNPYLFDGEKTNSIYQSAMNNATKLAIAKFNKDAADKLGATGEGSGFVGLPGVDISAL